MKNIKTSIGILSFIAMGALLMLSYSCKKDNSSNNSNSTTTVTAPTITTSSVGSLTQTSASCGGTITSDGGGTITVSGICWSTGATPTTSDSKTTNGSTSGSFSCFMTGLTASTKYYVCAYCTNSAGTAYGSIVSFTTQPYGSVYDIDGNKYSTVTIGTQVWMAENLKVLHYNNGTAIPYSATSVTSGAYSYYATFDTAKYGLYYNFYAVSSGNLAPTGWHVPTNAEWTTLITYLGGATAAAGALKETGTTDWMSPNSGATNSSGFTALPGGYNNGTPTGITQNGNFWSSSASGSDAYYLYLYYGSSPATQNDGPQTMGLSVRCVQN